MNAIVTGGAGDIGGACVRLLASSGWNVLIVDAERPAAERLAEEINLKRDAAAAAEVADVSVAADVRRYVEVATGAWGAIGAVVHAAGLAGPAAPLPDFDEAEFDRVMAVNARGTFLGLKYALPAMRDGGAIVNVASVSGIAGYPMVAAYVASKHAVIGLTRTAALDGAPRGIRVNAVCPGPVDTRMIHSLEEQLNPADPASVGQRYQSAIPMGRYVHPEEIANTVLFLCSDHASAITGAQYVVDGGRTATGGAVTQAIQS
jgi:NAD(P)-dependent dehydrogenase (short-subunit alcohol dehydrogenase family)